MQVRPNNNVRPAKIGFVNSDQNAHLEDASTKSALFPALLMHFAVNCERGKRQRYHKRHGINNLTHGPNITQLRQLQQLCYRIVTMLRRPSDMKF
jgi:hypothetical protein